MQVQLHGQLANCNDGNENFDQLFLEYIQGVCLFKKLGAAAVAGDWIG